MTEENNTEKQAENKKTDGILHDTMFENITTTACC